MTAPRKLTQLTRETQAKFEPRAKRTRPRVLLDSKNVCYSFDGETRAAIKRVAAARHLSASALLRTLVSEESIRLGVKP